MIEPSIFGDALVAHGPVDAGDMYFFRRAAPSEINDLLRELIELRDAVTKYDVVMTTGLQAYLDVADGEPDEKTEPIYASSDRLVSCANCGQPLGDDNCPTECTCS